MKANVYITRKAGVLDPQGQAVEKTLGQLGFADVASVRIGKFVEIELSPAGESPASPPLDREGARARVVQMCEQLIANTVIEEYRVEIVK